jgi:hypothetical protein
MTNQIIRVKATTTAVGSSLGKSRFRMQDPWILGSPVSGAEGVSASVPFRESVIRGHCRTGQFVASIEAVRLP